MLGTVISHFVQLNKQYKVKTVGDVPTGLVLFQCTKKFSLSLSQAIMSKDNYVRLTKDE